ncbi:hypothetical protein [Acinetobacter junii]|uniref:Uncharacterized protein n=1 Tax=Acinetobacter junii TaxID=40215 RepID=A0ABU8ZGK6_ACIJU|nr:hypothetical protein [Acinetobacter junii]
MLNSLLHGVLKLPSIGEALPESKFDHTDRITAELDGFVVVNLSSND